MQSLKTAVAVFCTACICAELVAQLTESSWARHGIKAIAGLYILAVAIHAFPQVKAESLAFSIPAASSVELGTWDSVVLDHSKEQLEQQLEAQCQEEFGVMGSFRIRLQETEQRIDVAGVTIFPAEECAEAEQQEVNAWIRENFGVTPEWGKPGGERA